MSDTGELVILMIVGLLLPLTMLGMGLLIWKTKPPYKDMFGYNSTYSQNNERLWNMGQELFGRYCTITYTVITVISILGGLVPIIFDIDHSIGQMINMIIQLVQFFSVFAVIGVTDIKLKKAYKDDEKVSENSNENFSD